MKNNKGFIGATLLLAVGVSALVAVGIAYLTTPKVIERIETVETVREIQLGSDNAQFVAAPPARLYGSGIGITDTSIKLQSFKTRDGSLLTMTDFGDIGYATLDPDSDSKFELVSFTGVTQNADGTATITGVTRGLLPVAPYTASTTLRDTHSGGAKFIISNPPQLYSEAAFKDNDESITGQFTFPTSTRTAPKYGTSTTYTLDGNYPTSTFADIDYVNRVATSGAADASPTIKGVVEEATCAELASSTSVGGTTAPLFARSTCFSATSSLAGVVPVIGSNNKLAQTFWNLTEGFTFSGGVTSTAATTLSATTTISGNVSSTGQFTFGNIPTIPSSTPTFVTEVASKQYVDDVVIGKRIWMRPGEGFLSSSSTMNHIVTSSIPVVNFPANGGVTTWTSSVVVPAGFTTVSSTYLYFFSDRADNVALQFLGYQIIASSTAYARVLDTSDTYTSYGQGNSGKINRITIPTIAYDGITLSSGDLFGFAINRSDGDGGDSSNAAFMAVGVEILFK